jgi:hypothetical protein
MGIIVLAGLVTIPTYLSGEGAEDIVEKLPGISEKFIKVHEEAAEKAVWFVGIAAIAALIGFVVSWKKHAVSKRMLLGIELVALVAVGILAWTNELGGEISHPEIRRAVDASAPMNPVGEAAGEKDDD